MQAGDLCLMEAAEAVSKRSGLGPVKIVSVEVAATSYAFVPLKWCYGARFPTDK